MFPGIISTPTQWPNRVFSHAVGSSQCRTSGWAPRIALGPGSVEYESLSPAKRPAPSVGRCTCSAIPDNVSARELSQQPHRPPNAVLELAKLSPSDTKSAYAKPMVGSIPDAALIISLAVAQVVTLTGSLVGGKLARKRRLEMEQLNNKLRKVCLQVTVLQSFTQSNFVVHELRKQKEAEVQSLVCEADPNEAISSYQRALEASMSAPAAAHPQETYGVEGISLASTRRKIATLLLDAKADLGAARPGEAELKCTDALVRCDELADKRASRAVLRVMGRAQRELVNYSSAIQSFNKALEISKELGDASGDVDTLGMIADVYVEMGEFEKAAKIYDDVLYAIQTEDDTSVLSSTWDC